MGAPGFWDDQARATAVSTEHARLSKRLERYERLQGEHDDAAELLQLEPELSADIETQLQPLRRELERLQEDALFNGEYDAGDAVVSIHAGAGGTDAQDWAEMLLRMYLRWAARPRLPGRARRGEPGRGGGAEVGDADREGRERLRPLQGRARRPPARAPEPVRQRPSPPHGVRAGRRRAAPARRERGRDRRERPADRHLPRLGRRRPAREQDRLRRPDHAPARAGSSSSARTSARRRRTSRRRCASSSPASSSSRRRNARPSSPASAAPRRTPASEVKSGAMCSSPTSS